MTMLSASAFNTNCCKEDEFERKNNVWNVSLRSTGYWDDVLQEDEADQRFSDEDTVFESEEEEMPEKSLREKNEQSLIAAKAKEKFLENLHKFQQKTAKTTSSPFERSYRPSGDQAASPSRNLRRSHRAIPSHSSNHSRNHTRRSLRKLQGDDCISDLAHPGREVRLAHDNDEHQVAFPATETGSDSNGVTTANDIRTMPGTGVSTLHEYDSLAPTSVKRRRSRPEIAAEKHKNRIRKVSASGKVELKPQSTPAKPKSKSSKDKEKVSSTLESSEEFELPTPETFQSFDDIDNWRDVSFMDDSPLKAVIDMLSNDLTSSSQENQVDRETSSFPRQPDDVKDATFLFDNLDAKGRKIAPPAAVTNRQFSQESSASSIKSCGRVSETTDPASDDYLQGGDKPATREIPSSEDRTQNSGSKDHLSALSAKYDNDLKSTTKLLHKSDKTSSPAAAINHRPEVTASDPKTSKNLPFESNTNAPSINYSVDDAIDTFRKLSQEIDFIKSSGFRHSVTETNSKPKTPVSRSKGKSISHPITTVYETPQQKHIILLSDNSEPRKKLSQNCLLTDNTTSGNSSLPSEREEKKRNKKEERKEHNETFDQKTAHTNLNNHLLNESDQQKNNTPERDKNNLKSFDENYHFSQKKSQDCKGTEPETLIREEFTFKPITIQSDEESITQGVTSAKMSVSIESPPVKSGSGSRFRKLSAVQRREKLRQVVLRHKSNPTLSDSESSLLSDASSNASDIDMNWLEDEATDGSVFTITSDKKKSKKSSTERTKLKKDPPISNGSITNGHATNGDRSESPKPNVGNMMAMWETKTIASSKPVRSTPPVVEIDGTQNKLSEAKAAYASSAAPKSPATRRRRRKSFEKDEVENGVAENGAGEPHKIGSMLSMWEKKEEKPRPTVKATEEEAFDSKVVGRLKGAKELFENMSKQNDHRPIVPRTHNDDRAASPKTASLPIHEAKSLFEKKNHDKESAASSPRTRRSREPHISSKSTSNETSAASKPRSRRSENLKSSNNSSTVAVSNQESPVTRRTRRRRDLERSDDTDFLRASSSSEKSDRQETVTSSSKTRRRHARLNDQHPIEKTEIKSSKDAETKQEESRSRRRRERWEAIEKEKKMETAQEKSVEKQSTVPAKATLRAPKSNVQSKISARKKRERRPMTQPITVEDVTSAKQLMHKREPSSDHSSKDSESQEEEQLSFSERLEYFNQLISHSKHVEPEDKQSGRRHRGSVKRYLTQPIDRDAVEQARELQKNYQATQLEASQSEQGFENKQTTVENHQTEVQSNITETDLNVEIVTKSVSETDVLEDRPKKVGKLSTDLKTKFLETQPNNFQEETKPRRSPRRPRSNIPSETSSNSSSSASRHQVLRDCSSSPLPGAKSHTEEDTTSENSDMGKNRENEIKATGSIHDRLKLLEKNKDEGWRKRLKEENKTVKSSLGDRLSKLQDSEDKWKKSKPTPLSSVKSSTENNSNISGRLNSILSNSEKWKSKAGKQNDATQFTVQAKIAKRDGQEVGSVANYTVKRKTQPVAVKNEPVVTIDDVTSSAPSLNKLSEVLKLSKKGLEPEVIKTTESATTEIPNIVNEDFENFFTITLMPSEEPESPITNGLDSSDSEDTPSNETPAWFDDDFEHTKVNNRLSDIGRLKANVKRPSVRNKRSSRNPVKALAARTDVKQSYTEHRSNVSKLEQQRIASRHGFGANFTAGALAGLAAKADLSKVNLRSTKKNPAFSASDHKPWRDKMLLRVKGRRHVQTRLVAPACSSLNSGDAFLLILPDKLFAWFGEFSNVIEKAKVQEIADYIIHKGDLGSKATQLITIKEESSSSIRAKEFWNYLGGKGDIEPSGGAKEDEMYEVNAEATIKSYKLENSKLIPYQDSWGKLPTMGQLSTNSTFVFDFGGEMYIWHGKEVTFEDRQLAIKLAKTLWDQGYDYSDSGFCPFLPHSKAFTSVKGERPEWGLFARVNENLETALIQEKFEDWSNIAREIGDRDETLKVNSRGQLANEMNIKTNIAPDMTSCNVNEMKENKSAPLPLKLEGYNMWKGHGLMCDEDGRRLLVVTNSVSVWHASDKALTSLDDDQKGIFYRGETYVIRWRYVVSSTGKWKAEESAGNDLKSDPKGRERVAYFLWPGSESTVNEKGASALMATEIDKDVGTQVVVTEGKEPPSFVQCFNGKMLVVDGKQGSREGFYSWRLFCVRGSCKEEAILYQVPCHVTSLRSRASFIAVHGRQAKVVIWHGAKSTEQTKEVAAHAAAQIQNEKRTCLGFRANCKQVSVETCEEENENSDFNDAIGRIRRSKYMSLAGFKSDKVPCPRIWHLTPDKEQFVAKALPPVAETVDEEGAVINCFPYSQQQLKELNKPALILLDNSEGVYLWQSGCDEELTGSSKRQYDISRRLAMETTQDYCKSFRSGDSSLLIHENHEPIEFTNSFPIWKEADKKISFEEKRLKKPQPIEEVLKTICRLTYTLEELRATPLPEGVDPNHLETYLSVSDFNDLFNMSKKEFYSFPPWKQHNLRKEKNLF